MAPVSQKMREVLNALLNGEFQAAHNYSAVAAYFHDVNLKGLGKYFEEHSDEERTHAKRVYEYMLNRGVRIDIGALEKPPNVFDSPVAALRWTLTNEIAVSANYNAASDLAMEEKDHGTYHALAWFVKEQMEEETSFHDLLVKAESVGNNQALLFQLDAHVKHE